MSSSSVSVDSDFQVQQAFTQFPECLCKRKPKLAISTTSANPQRRYLRCSLQTCGFFRWVDPWRPSAQTEDLNSLMSVNAQMNKQCQFLEENMKELRASVSELKAQKNPEMCELKAHIEKLVGENYELKTEKEYLKVQMEHLKVEKEHLKAQKEHMKAQKEELKNKMLIIKVVVVCLVVLLLSHVLV